MAMNKSVGNEQKCWVFDCATGNSDRLRLCRLAGYHVDGRTVRKQVHRVESRMEYYWNYAVRMHKTLKH